MYSGVIDRKVEQKLNEYKAIFLDIFPLMQFDGTKEELIAEIDNCIRNEQEYDTSFWDEHPEYDD